MISDFVQLSIVSHLRLILIKIKKTKQKVNSISIGHTKKSPLSYPGGDFQGDFTIAIIYKTQLGNGFSQINENASIYMYMQKKGI